MAKEKNLLAPDGLETATLTREQWQLIDMAICGFIALCALKAAAPRKEKLQEILSVIRELWYQDRHEKRSTGFCRVCGHYGSDCTGRQRPRAHSHKELA